MAQKRTSKNTSINSIKLPAIYNKVDFSKYKSVLDYGCGRYTDHLKEKVEQTNCNWYGYDPFWEIGEEKKADLVICSNVLNVIDDDEALESVIHRLFSLGKDVVIKIYEGKGNNIGAESKEDQWQRNETTEKYWDLITNLGFEAERKGTYIFGKSQEVA